MAKCDKEALILSKQRKAYTQEGESKGYNRPSKS